MRIHASGAASELAWPSTNAFIDATAWLAIACLAMWSVQSSPREGTLTLSWRSPFLWGGLAFTLATVVAAIRAPHTDIAVRTAVSWLTNGALAASLLSAGLRRRDLARDMLCLLGATVVSVSVLALYEYLIEWQQMRAFLAANPDAAMANVPEAAREDFQRRLADPAAMGPFLLPNLLGAFIATITPLALALGLVSAQRGGAARYTGLGLACVIAALAGSALMVTRAKGAVLAAATALAVALVILAARRWRRLLAPVAVVLVVAAVSVAGLGLASWRRDPEAFGMGRSIQVRLEYARASLSMVHSQPLLGVGLGNWRHFYSQHRPAQAEETRYAHMDLLQLTAETGLLGPLGLGMILLGAIAGLVSAVRNDAKDPPERRGEVPTDSGLHKACLVGACLGTVLLAGLGTRYASMGSAILILGLLVPAWLALSDAASKAGVGSDPATRPTLAAAALAGSAAFGVSSLLDFPFHATGIQAAWFISLALVGALVVASPLTPPRPGLRQRRLAWAATSALVAVLLTAVYVPALRDADSWRRLGEISHRDATTSTVETSADRDTAVEQLELAITHYRRAQSAWPLGVQALMAEAAAHSMLARLGDNPQRLEASTRALRLARERAPRRADIAHRLAATLLEMAATGGENGDQIMLQARKELETAVRLYPHHPAYRLRLAQVSARLGDTVSAASHAAAALKSDGQTRNKRLRLTDAQRAEASQLGNPAQDD